MRQHGGMTASTSPETAITIDVDGTPVSGVYSRPADAAATIVVAHGAGAGMEHPFMSGFTRAMHDLGYATLRFNFPYREAKRRFPDRPPVAIATWRAALAAAAERAGAGNAGEPIRATTSSSCSLGMANGSFRPCRKSIGTVMPGRCSSRAFSGRPGGCSG